MSIFKECPVCGAHLDPGETCNCREPKLVTYADWEAAGSFEKAASPGDAVVKKLFGSTTHAKKVLGEVVQVK